MSTVITATCRHCNQPASIPAEAVLLDLDAHSVSWLCDVCGDVEEQDIAVSLLPQLVDSGVSLISSQDAHASGHPEAPPAGHALTLDDVLAMHEVLASTCWQEDLERAMRAQQAGAASDAA